MYYNWDLMAIEKDFVQRRCEKNNFEVRFKKVRKMNCYHGFEIPNGDLNYGIKRSRFANELRKELYQLRKDYFLEKDYF